MARKPSIILTAAEEKQARNVLPSAARPPAPKAPTARTIARRRKLPALKNPLLAD